jgi:hypothetical protein
MRVRSLVVSLTAMPVPLLGTSVACAPAQPTAAQYAEPQKGRPVKTRRRRIRVGCPLSLADVTGKLERCQASRKAVSDTRGERITEDIAPFRTSYLPTSLVVRLTPATRPGKEES